MTIINPKYSFVQFSETPQDCETQLQIATNDELAFQIRVITDTVLEALTLMDDGVTLNVVSAASLINMGTLFDFDIQRIGEKELLLCWGKGFHFYDIHKGVCFRIHFELDGTDYYSNCFFYNPDEAFTTVVSYSCDENAYGFNYCEGCQNRVRLPFHLMKPQLTDDETVYVRSDGSRQVLKSITSQSWEGETEHLAFSTHEKIKIALSHDNVEVRSKNYTGGIRKEGSYEIQWPSFPAYREAPATFKVFATPYLVRNDNCQVCEPFEPSCKELAVLINLPEAIGGEAYNEEIPISGTNPVLTEIIEKPDWLSISHSGNKLIFTGTAPLTGGDGTVKVKLTNDCSEITPEGEIIVSHDCTEVAIVGAPVLPNGQVGAAYYYEINFTGSTPLNLSDITKPSWATLTLSGKKVIVAGTPDVDGTGIEIGLTVTNCEEGEVIFSQDIDIAPAPTNRHLDNNNYSGMGGAITGDCTVDLTFSRTHGARDDAYNANDRIKAIYEVAMDNNCIDFAYEVVFEPGDEIVTHYAVDMNCGGVSNPCSATDHITCISVQVIP